VQLAADTDPAVKNGAELLDRLIKDIVTEQASTYVSHAALSSPLNSPRASTSMSMLSTHEYDKLQQPERAFSLPRFIPLLRERIYVVNPFTRTYLVSWLIVLDSVPELELVSYLPDFLDGLLKFLADPIVDIRTTTQNVLADFLKGIREVAEVQQGRDEEWRGRREGDVSREEDDGAGRRSRRTSRGSDLVGAMDAAGVHDSASEDEREESGVDSEEEDYIDEGDEGEGSGAWIPGQGVPVDHGAIVEIFLEHLTFSGMCHPPPSLACLTNCINRRGDSIDLSPLDR
jgi:vacuole morphology and inheritance protein 14